MFLSRRLAKYFKTSENIETRTLIKAYGIRFEVIVLGEVCLLVSKVKHNEPKSEIFCSLIIF